MQFCCPSLLASPGEVGRKYVYREVESAEWAAIPFPDLANVDGMCAVSMLEVKAFHSHQWNNSIKQGSAPVSVKRKRKCTLCTCVIPRLGKQRHEAGSPELHGNTLSQSVPYKRALFAATTWIMWWSWAFLTLEYSGEEVSTLSSHGWCSCQNI